MDCRDIERLIDAYWDRELDPGIGEAVGQHLRGCTLCDQRYGAVNAFLTTPDEIAVPSGLRDRVFAALDSSRSVKTAPRIQDTQTSSPRMSYRLAPLAWAGALAVRQSLAGLLFGVRPTDPWSFVGVVVVLISAGLLASYFPARRATRVDPIAALRSE